MNGSTQEKPKFASRVGSLFRKKWFIGVSIFVVVLLISLAYYFVFINKKNTDSTKTEEVISKSEERQKNYDSANSIAKGGDYEKAQKQLDSSLSMQKTAEDRSEVYSQKAVLALDNNKKEDALSYAKKAEESYKSQASANIVAQIAEATGDKALALTYFKLALERMTNDQKQYFPDEIKYYQQKIEELQKQ